MTCIYLGPVASLPFVATGVVLTGLLLSGLGQRIAESLRVCAGNRPPAKALTAVWRALHIDRKSERKGKERKVINDHHSDKLGDGTNISFVGGGDEIPWTTLRPPTRWGRDVPHSPAAQEVVLPGSTGLWCGWGSRSVAGKHKPRLSAEDLYHMWPSRSPTHPSPTCVRVTSFYYLRSNKRGGVSV